MTIFADAEVDRSPCGTGTCAVMAVLAAMGLLGAGPDVRAREHHRHAVPRPGGGETTVGDHPAIVPEIEGEAYITGENVFLIDEADPLRHGFRL